MSVCRLCFAKTTTIWRYKDREYQRCSSCFLIQLQRSQCPAPAAEEAEYQLHKNDPYDIGYRRFLSPVTAIMLEWLQTKKSIHPVILDFGSGPGPTISVVLGEHGWNVRNYDPFFQPDTAALQIKYDLISSTEVVEHFYEPNKSWKLLFSLGKKSCQLVVMTQCSDPYYSETAFQNWRYIREKSHVAFYHSRTMEWIAAAYGFQITQRTANVFWFSR